METKQSSVEWFSNQAYELFEQYSEGNFNRRILNKLMVEATEQAKAMERELIKESCIMAIMQWNEWDKTNYLDLYDHKIEGAEIWAEDYCKELYEEIKVPNPNFNKMTLKEKAEELIRKYYTFGINKQGQTLSWYECKKCALIAVDEILNDDWYIATREDLIARKEYWNEVKQEIEKL